MKKLELAQINLMSMILMLILPTQLMVAHWANYSMKPSLLREQNLPSMDVMFTLEQQKTKWLMPCSWQLIFIISYQQKNALN